MGNCNSQQIKVVPVNPSNTGSKPISSSHNGTDWMRESHSSSGRKSSTSVSSSHTQRGFSRPPSSNARVRPLSRMSRKSGRIGGGMYQGMGRIGGRPISRTDSLNLSGKEDKLRETFGRRTAGLAATSSGLNQSLNKQISFPDPNPCESSSSEEFHTTILRPANESEPVSATKCPCCLSQFGKIVHVPYLLLCGHTYCSSCINIALKNDPSFLKCGVCSISTSVQPQSESKDLVLNEPILELVESKDFLSILSNSMFDRCAECDRELATTYCSDCSASYCEECNKQQHTGSRVRSKHKPVPISLKPRPQPTCKKHPGQSCVLYCETERQPMCVLCKFYGHHKFHNYQLLNNSSSNYRTSLSQKLSQLEKIEASLYRAAQNLTDSKQEIKKKANEAQEKLERSFEEAKEELIATLEQREAMLLVLLDRQVQKREEIVQDEQEEVAFARARAIAAIEEAKKLLDLNPVSALLARKHIDSVVDTVLKQTVSFPDESTDNSDDHHCAYSVTSQLLPLGLKPKQELAKKMNQTMEQHGAILQLPEKPIFSQIKVLKDSILIQWKICEENTEVASDRTLTYSLQCFADVPFRFKKDKFFSFSKRIVSVNNSTTGFSPDSGFQDEASEKSSQASESRPVGPSLPSLPPSLHNNNNVSLVALQETRNTTNHSNPLTTQDNKSHGVSTPISGIETPKKPLFHGMKDGFMTPSMRTSGALLNLPPLVQKKETATDSHCQALSNSDLLTASNVSGETADIESGTPQAKKVLTVNEPDSLSSSATTLNSATITTAGNVNDLGRYCKGYAFEEIYSGRERMFHYSGIVRGATYYFRLRCHNAAGTGAWSNTYKCSVPSLSD